MAPKAKKTNKQNPVAINLLEGEVLSNGTLAVSLATLADLETFWRANAGRFPYACQGLESGSEAVFMREYQWVFGPSKSSVVETVMRLGQSSITTSFYSWKEAHPQDWRDCFRDREDYREHALKAGDWTNADEAKWQASCQKKTPETYTGWWRFQNLPECLNPDDWFSNTDPEELFDPEIPVSDVTQILCEQTFDEWRQQDFWELETHDSESILIMIDYWKKEQAIGEDYYGRENESSQATH